MLDQGFPRAGYDNPNENLGDQPPAYDALSIHQSTSPHASQSADPLAFPEPVAGPNQLNSTSQEPSVLNVNKTLPQIPSSLDAIPSSSGHARSQRPRPHKNTSWLSLLPFASSHSAKRVRQSILSIVGDLAVPPSRLSAREQKNVHETFASLAETCAEHKLSLSTILQEVSVADHTPIYWVIVNYRQELLVALLVHSRPLSIATISDIRRACLVSSNQALFHALRVCRPPFHVTDGIQVPDLGSASNNLLLGNCPTDEIHIQQAGEHGFIVSFDIPLWQRRLKVIGRVGIEFIASDRMWSVTFFSIDAGSKTAKSGKSKQDNSKNTWYIMVGLLESSPPTYFDSQLVVDGVHPCVPHSTREPRLREVRSAIFPSSHDEWHRSRSPMYDHDGMRHLQSPGPSSTRPGTTRPPSIFIRLGSGDRKLCRRAKAGEPPEHAQKLTTTPATWSHHNVGYTSAVVSPLGEGLASHLLYDHSRYLSADGTLRGRLEARFIKSESSKNCIIC